MQNTYETSLIRNQIKNRKSVRTSSKNFKYSLSYFTFVLFMLLPLFFLEYRKELDSDTFFSIFSFILIGFWAFTALYFAARETPFTLNCSHWVFFIFFFFYAPLVQFVTSTPPNQTDHGFFDTLSFEANLLLFLWCVFYSLSYAYAKKSSKLPQKKSGRKEDLYIVNINYMLLVALSISAIAGAYLIVGAGPLLSRNLIGYSLENSGKATTLIVNTIFRAIPAAAFALSICDPQPKTLLRYIATFIIASIAILINSPFAVPRFWFGAFLIGVICILIRNKKRSGLWFPIASVISLLYVLPILNLGRYNTFTNIDWSAYQNRGLLASLTSGDFDAYSMLINTIAYKDVTSITEGSQLLGNLLFFFPRSMWSGKPSGSGQTVAEYFDFRFTNLSEPLPAEGYINFGIMGVILYACILAWFFARLDFNYWKALFYSRSPISTLYLVYPFGIGFTLFFMRGDFLSGFSYTSGFALSAFIVIKLCSKRALANQNQVSKP